MWDWLSHLDPNVILPIVITIGAWIYHRIVPSSAQQTVDATAHQIDAIKDLLMAEASTMLGKTPEQMRIALRGLAAVQLAKWGYNADKLPPVVAAGVDAAVNAAIAWLVTQPKPPPKPGEVPITIPPVPFKEAKP